MEQNKREQFIIRRIGGTTYKVRVVFNDIKSWNGIWAWYGRLRKKRKDGKICLLRKRKRHFIRYQSCVTLPDALRS